METSVIDVTPRHRVQSYQAVTDATFFISIDAADKRFDKDGTPKFMEEVGASAVELTEERMVILGQVAEGIDPESLEVGQEMELVLGTLYEDDENEYVVWKWKPVAG